MSSPTLRQLILNCERCKELAANRKNVVVGEAAKNTSYLFLGEMPGVAEDASGKPFVGPSGMFLRRALQQHGMIPRQNTSLINVIKCCPPASRSIRKDEYLNCEDYTVKQIEYLKPKVIIALGRYAHAFITQTPSHRIKVLDDVGKRACYEGISCIRTYHPGFLLRMNVKEIHDAFHAHLEWAVNKVKGMKE
jgi:DNA polymerase